MFRMGRKVSYQIFFPYNYICNLWIFPGKQKKTSKCIQYLPIHGHVVCISLFISCFCIFTVFEYSVNDKLVELVLVNGSEFRAKITIKVSLK